MTPDGMRDPEAERPHLGGIQRAWRFANGYGASVIRNSRKDRYRSIGNEHGEGLWELCVLKQTGPDWDEDWEPCYSTPIGGRPNVAIGNLTPAQVNELLVQIEALPAAVTPG